MDISEDFDKSKVSASKPCIFRIPEEKWEHLKGAKKEKNKADPTPIQACMDSWKTQSPEFAVFKSKDRASAPLYEQHGKNTVMAFFRQVMGDIGMTEVNCADYPSLERTFKSVFCWAYSECIVLFASEPNQLPGLRFILEGSSFCFCF